jgi:hypothetical protein
MKVLEVACCTSLCGAYGMLGRMVILSGVTDTWWDAGGDFSLAQTPAHSPLEVTTGMSTPRLLCTMPPLGVFFCMLVAGLALCFGKSSNLN